MKNALENRYPKKKFAFNTDVTELIKPVVNDIDVEECFGRILKQHNIQYATSAFQSMNFNMNYNTASAQTNQFQQPSSLLPTL